MAPTDDRITMYSDYVCPFCYLGRQSLDSYRDSRVDRLELDWRPFDLRSSKRGPDGEIDHAASDGKDDEYFQRARENVLRLQDEYGAEEMLDPDEVSREIDSLDAQVASFYVQSEHPEQWDAFDERIFEAHWVDGRDIGDVDVLADLADGVGLDPAEIRRAVTDDGQRQRVRDAFTEAQRRGITGVPTFVYGEHAARGAVPPAHIERLVEGT